MSNRSYSQSALTLENQPVTLWCEVAIGAAGAPTLTTAKSKGVASVVRNSAGNYTLTLSDAYRSLLQVQFSNELAAGVPAVSGVVVRSQNTTGKSLVLEFLNSAGAATDPSNGAVLRLTLVFKRSSV